MKQITMKLRDWQRNILWLTKVLWPDPLPSRPKGKLGEIIRYVEGNPPEDLVILTGWRKSTIHAALSRLRARGFAIDKSEQNGHTCYSLSEMD